MSTHRYYIATMPVAHINGKMAPTAVKCKDTANPDEVEHDGFWYGYRIGKRPLSRYGIRTRSRYLGDKPYTAGELENRTAFTLALQTMNAHYEVAPDWELATAEFKRQSEYISIRGYVVARCRALGGDWPPEWT